jgi:hypothetical protein
VLQESNITSSALLPLIGLLVELEELCAHLENLLLELLVGLDLNFLGETDDRFEVDIFWLRGFILRTNISAFASNLKCGAIYLWVLLSSSGLLSLCGSRYIATVLILFFLFLLGSSTEHRENVVGDSRRGGGDGRGSGGSSVRQGLLQLALKIVDLYIKEVELGRWLTYGRRGLRGFLWSFYRLLVAVEGLLRLSLRELGLGAGVCHLDFCKC